MPSIQPCPDCGKKVRVPDDAVGKKLRCPGCQNVLVIGDDGLELPSRSAIKPSMPSRRRDDDDDEDRPRRRSRRDDDDDDDEPRSKRRDRDDDDEDDDRPRRRRKKRAGIPLWVWLTGGGVAAAAIIGVVLIFVLGGGSKFSKVKEGMTAKEVVELLGEPMDGDTKFSATWTHPRLERKDLMDVRKIQNVKELLIVTFSNGKVQSVKIISASEWQKGLGGF